MFVILCSFVSEAISLCCHLPYKESLPCGIGPKSVFFKPTDKGREVGMPSTAAIVVSIEQNGMCSYSLCAPGHFMKEGTYCATGPCNIFGCNCDGECIDNSYASRARRSVRSRPQPSSHNLGVSPTHTPGDRFPIGSSLGYNDKAHHDLFDYNGNFITRRKMVDDIKKVKKTTGSVSKGLAINTVPTLAAEYVSKKWLFPEPNRVNDTALSTILKEYKATLQEIVMKFNQPFHQLSRTQQDAYSHQRQIMKLISDNNGNATQAIEVLRNHYNTNKEKYSVADA